LVSDGLVELNLWKASDFALSEYETGVTYAQLWKRFIMLVRIQISFYRNGRGSFCVWSSIGGNLLLFLSSTEVPVAKRRRLSVCLAVMGQELWIQGPGEYS